MPANIDLTTSAVYESAGVRFNLSLTSSGGPDQASFTFTVDDLASGKRLDFSHQACPALHDTTRGFAR